MADIDAVHLGLDENEADIAEELQDFDDSFDTRSEASESGSDSSDSQPSISSVSTTPSSIGDNRKSKTKSKPSKDQENDKKKATKRDISPAASTGTSNGKNIAKKKRPTESVPKIADIATTTFENKKTGNGNKKGHKKQITATVANGTNTVEASGNKSDCSDAEDKPAPTTNYDSDSESEDSDSAANIKRNGRKAVSKSESPEKKLNNSSNNSNNNNSNNGSNNKNAKNSTKSYDYMTKINYLFRDTRFFLIKSNNSDNITLSKNKNVWATLPQNDANLNQAFKEARNVLLIFSVNESGKFAGFARMSAQSRRDIPQVAWVLPPSISLKALGGVIEIDWICRKELSFNCTSHLYNSWNEGKPVKIGRDGQEIEPKVGAELCRLFPEDEKIELTPILRKSKETAKLMREKGIRVVYKVPRSLPSRGGGGRGGFRQNERRGGSDNSGPIRHKRTYGGSMHRPYKLSPMGPPTGGFKRSSSPYRNGPGGTGSSRLVSGDGGLPPWDRYMSAEAYVADYMRTMHGQLPPLPFVPPFAQMPLPGAGSSAPLPPSAPSSIYEQLPPPVRYYDGPPLPDYPPPQPIRPPPPGFDKTPSYEDFAVWKNAGLPTVPGGMPPGFPGFGSSGGGLSASNSGSGIGGGSGGPSGSNNSGNNFASSGSGAGGSGNNSYRNRDNRARERGAGRDYHRGGGNIGGSSSRSASERDRHFRSGGSERSSQRNYRDARR